MFSAFGQFAATSQFYLYGRTYFTRTGWEKASKHYKTINGVDVLEDPNLSLEGKVYMVTGANSGIGREVTRFLASKGATVYMVCRNRFRGETAQTKIIETTKNDKVHLIVADCSLESGVRQAWQEFLDKATAANHSNDSNEDLPCKLDGLICNAGVLHNEKTVTSEGVESTFATHLLFGVYLLGKLALQSLQQTPNSRIVVISSGGLYNTKFPSWEKASSTGKYTNQYDGQLVYAYAKRGQLLLCERWAELYSANNMEQCISQERRSSKSDQSTPTPTGGNNNSVKFLCCHPGWVGTEGLDAAYGETKSYLEPLRSIWQGAEGIIYLATASGADFDVLQSGEFFLDRSPQAKHMSGPFFSEGSYTKNSREEVDTMMQQLELWADSQTRPTVEDLELDALLSKIQIEN